MVKWYHETEQAKKIKLEMKGDIQEYALNFLHIFNNAKNNTDMIYNISNDYENGVYITCPIKHVETVSKYIEQFGEIVEVYDIKIVRIDYHYSEQAFDELYGDTDETMFMISDC